MDDLYNVTLTPEGNALLRMAEREAKALGKAHITTLHVLIALLIYPKGPWNMVGKVTPENLRELHSSASGEGTGHLGFDTFDLPISEVTRNVICFADRLSKRNDGPGVSPTMLLAAVLEEPGGDAVHALKKLQFDIDPLRKFFSKHCMRAERAISHPRPFSRRARLAIERASRTAAQDGIDEYCTRYLLYGLAATPGCICSALLSQHGTEAKDIKAMIAEHTPIERTKRDRSLERASMSYEVATLIPHVFHIADQDSPDAAVAPEHILLALLKHSTHTAELLIHLNIDQEALLDDLARVLEN